MKLLLPARAVLATPAVQLSMLDFTTIDGQRIPYPEGLAALRTGQALLVGGWLVGYVQSPVAGAHWPWAA